MEQNYQTFVERMILHYEGGYGWDKADDGGPTKYGITCWDLAAYLGEKMTSMSAWAPRVRAMTMNTADEIYKKKYATACKFNSLNSGKDCAVFDFGVNSGTSRAIKFSQVIVKTNVDGILGPLTLKAINDYDAAKFIDELCDARMRFLRQLKNWKVFGNGWTARVKDLRSYSKKLLVPVATALMAMPETEQPSDSPHDKEFRIPKAFPKGLDGEDLGNLKKEHSL